MHVKHETFQNVNRRYQVVDLDMRITIHFTETLAKFIQWPSDGTYNTKILVDSPQGKERVFSHPKADSGAHQFVPISQILTVPDVQTGNLCLYVSGCNVQLKNILLQEKPKLGLTISEL